MVLPPKHTLPQLPEVLSPEERDPITMVYRAAAEAHTSHLWACVRHPQEAFWSHERGAAAESVLASFLGALVC